MSASLTKRSPLPGIYGIPPFAFQGAMVLRRVPNPAADCIIACVVFDRSGAVVGVAKRMYAEFQGHVYPSVEVPFTLPGTAEYWAIAFGYQAGGTPVEWPSVSVVWSIQA